VALRGVSNAEDAEEVVQDAFLKAFGALGQFQRAAKFSTWLYRIVYNTALTKKRAQGRPRELPLTPATQEPAATSGDGWAAVRQADQQKYLALALARLPADDALVLTLHYLGEQSIAEICAILGKKTSAIKMQLLRSRQQLEAALLQLLPTEHQHLL
jgi:RNA polymerase sigma-70 factor (ECF subfamily)